MPRIALVTYAGLPALAADDQLVMAELRARGAAVDAAVWDDPAVAWEECDGVVLRSCWDYHLRESEFHAWLDRLDRLGVPLWNPLPLVRWNSNKRYLRDLAAAGVCTVPTRWVERGAAADLAGILAHEGWTSAVVKPVVSASAHETWRTRTPVTSADEERFRTLVSRVPAMVQPFVDAIVNDGEWSLCFIGGEYSHAVRKVPLPTDFRVQPQFGGGAHAASPPSDVVRQAHDVVDGIAGPWLYARVDGCVVNGRLWLLELEMLEPSLFLDHAPAAAGRFADVILAVISAGAVEPRRHRSVTGHG